MESTVKQIEIIYNNVKEYVNTSVTLYKFRAIDKTASAVSSLITRLALISTAAVFLLFINIGISLYIGQLLQENYLGFIIVSFFYLLIGLCIYFFKDTLITKPITNLLITKLSEEKDEL
ncbi:hypothetical protein C7447_103347 [Tenacibaculum adriaticum]|uniref:Uncharacterized protein n=1 Tax=Tenacibaculum adriaticum TaxID=413713 RepID=A0A5S5DQM0_9FLAO|nr:hypothetical protein [Tenacibaculum adriaticum]TYP98177.1 hypothetical protein C7447_103347 [Tenacibaculum adriaticum]